MVLFVWRCSTFLDDWSELSGDSIQSRIWNNLNRESLIDLQELIRSVKISEDKTLTDLRSKLILRIRQIGAQRLSLLEGLSKPALDEYIALQRRQYILMERSLSLIDSTPLDLTLSLPVDETHASSRSSGAGSQRQAGWSSSVRYRSFLRLPWQTSGTAASARSTATSSATRGW